MNCMCELRSVYFDDTIRVTKECGKEIDGIMNELRFVAACLEGEGTCFPSPEDDERNTVQERREAEKGFHQLLHELPQETAMKLEDSAFRLVNTWTSESYERGFAAGMRLAARIFVGN